MRKTYLIIGLLIATYFTSIAQKLPNIQETSVRAPANIKIDGKPSEWNNQFQAYNKSTEIFYTISNDNNKLYLAVQAANLDIINKIIEGGVIFRINGSGKMKDKGGKAITYPLLQKDKFRQTINIDKPDDWSADSFMVSVNNELSSKSRNIEVTGINGITSTLSVYNLEGIKAVALFDVNSILTYELAIPLKYLGLSVTDPKPFVYNIKLKGENYDGSFASFGLGFHHLRQKTYIRLVPGVMPVYINGKLSSDGPSMPQITQLISSTDFWGEYTLAK